MLQPHMIAVKLGRMGALSLPAGMGLWERPATVQPVRLSQGRRSAGHRGKYCTLYVHAEPGALTVRTYYGMKVPRS